MIYPSKNEDAYGGGHRLALNIVPSVLNVTFAVGSHSMIHKLVTLYTDIMRSARTNALFTTRSLIQRGANICALSSKNETILHFMACKK